MSALDRLAEPIWLGLAQHLWQSSLFLVVLTLLALALRNAPGRVQAAVWWAGVIKLLLPLPLLGAWTGGSCSPVLRSAETLFRRSP